MSEDAAAADSLLLSVCLAEGRFQPGTILRLTTLSYILDEQSKTGADFAKVIDLLTEVPPRAYGRVIAYLRQLSHNAATDPQANPREYARRVMRGKDESA